MTNTPTQENEELLPCPFCGNRDILAERFAGGWAVWCPTECCAGGYAPDEQRWDELRFAIKAWNTRPSPSTVSNRELVEEMIEITRAMLPNSTILDEAQEVDAEREERIAEALNRAIPALSATPVSTQTEVNQRIILQELAELNPA